MQCGDLMRHPVEHIDPTQSAVDAARTMSQKNIGILPVCGPDGRVLGVVTDRDLAVRVLGEERDPAATRVEDIMSTPVVTCRAEDDLERAEELMRSGKTSRVIVIDEDECPCGMISLADIAQVDRGGAADTLAAVTSREVGEPTGATAH
jgi:CBS domain-containing protein